MKTALIAALVAVSALTAVASSANARPYDHHGHRHQVCSFHHHHRMCGWR
jgi:Spy/CpxP family protein refolding chaperone